MNGTDNLKSIADIGSLFRIRTPGLNRTSEWIEISNASWKLIVSARKHPAWVIGQLTWKFSLDPNLESDAVRLGCDGMLPYLETDRLSRTSLRISITCYVFPALGASVSITWKWLGYFSFTPKWKKNLDFSVDLNVNWLLTLEEIFPEMIDVIIHNW